MYAPPAERHAQPFPRSPAMLAPQGPGLQDLVPGGDDRSMLASPAFWIGGAASVLCWTGLVMALLRFV